MKFDIADFADKFSMFLRRAASTSQLYSIYQTLRVIPLPIQEFPDFNCNAANRCILQQQNATIKF